MGDPRYEFKQFVLESYCVEKETNTVMNNIMQNDAQICVSWLVFTQWTHP